MVSSASLKSFFETNLNSADNLFVVFTSLEYTLVYRQKPCHKYALACHFYPAVWDFDDQKQCWVARYDWDGDSYDLGIFIEDPSTLESYEGLSALAAKLSLKIKKQAKKVLVDDEQTIRNRLQNKPNVLSFVL